MNVYDYVEKYGNYTFEEKPFNDVDNLVFSMLIYLEYNDTSIVLRDHTIEFIGKEYLKSHTLLNERKRGVAQKDAYKLMEIVIKTKRYKNIIMHDYVYRANINKQFSAVMFRINDNLEYISYEGTDELISGWKENLYLSCVFPVPAQRDAIDYANKHIKIFGPNIILGGHSKGGNLALVAGMYLKPLKQFRLKKIYSNDGPGLRLREFTSSEYRRIKRKLVHIIPEYSVVGVLLRNDIYNVVKATKESIMAHEATTWLIEDDHFKEGSLSSKSKKLEKNIISWLMNHSDLEKDKAVTELFTAIEKAEIKSLKEVSNVRKLHHLIENIKNIDNETKELFKNLIKDYIGLSMGRDE